MSQENKRKKRQPVDSAQPEKSADEKKKLYNRYTRSETVGGENA